MQGCALKIAYVLNTYPQPSHSFIRREIRALESQGVAVHRIAMRRAGVRLVDPQDHEEQARTDYVLDRGALALGVTALAALLRSPGRGLRALGLAIRTGRVSEVGLVRHLIYLAEAADLVRRCRELGADHVHAHFGTNAATVAMLAAALGGPGYGFTVHGPEEFDAPRSLSLPAKLDRARLAVAVSQFGRSQLMRWADAASWPRLHVVHCGIDTARFPAPEPIPSGPLRLVSIGRFAEQKGQLVLIEAMALLKPALPGVSLTLVGDGEMRGALQQAVAVHGLTGQVRFTGWLSEDGVRAELAAARALVMPSFAEGLPMVIMEAMALGRPVVSTFVAGIPELVRPGETGWLVPAGDAAALAAALRDLAATPDERLAAMGLAGRARALDRHDAAAQAARLRDLIAAAVAG